MSKAFTKETDADDDDAADGLPSLPIGGKNYITPAGYARLRAELLELMDSERPKIVESVHWAAKTVIAVKTAIICMAKSACVR